MKICNSCGASIPDDNAAFCNVCGANQPRVQQPFPNYGTGVRTPVTKEVFLENYASPDVKKGFKTAGIIGYVCAGLSLVVSVGSLAVIAEYLDTGILGYIIPVLIEIILMVILSAGIHTKQSKGCAIGLTVLGVVGCVYSLITSGRASSWLIIAAGAAGLSASKKLDKEYDAYVKQMNGNIQY